MLQRFKIDPIISFLGLGIILIILSFPTLVSSILKPEEFKLINGDVKNDTSIPSPNAGPSERISARAAYHILSYSFDGGDHFYEADESGIEVGEIKNPDILYKSTSIRWRHPAGNLPRLKTISVRLKDSKQKTITEPKHLTYIEGYDSKLPFVSLIISEDDLFDWEDGIMILGEKSSHQKNVQQKWWDRNANYRERTYTSRKRANFQYFENGILTIDQSTFLKIGGNATRSFPQKSLKIYPIDEYGRQVKFEYPFWGKPGNKKYESLVLRQSGNDNSRTLFADLLMHELAAESKVIVLNGYPVSVFINGNYWGIYNLRERIDDYMLSKREDSKTSDITILNCEGGANFCQLVDGDEEHKLEFEELIALVDKDHALTKLEFTQISAEINLKSFIDYIFFETYYANQDWLSNNTTWFKTKDGQWKWVLNDLDYSLAYPGADNVNANLFNTLLTKNSIMGQLFSGLLEVPEFKDKFIDRSKKHLVEIFNQAHLTEKFTALKSKYERDMQFEIDRWRSIDSYEAWEESCAANLKFLIDRKEIYLKQLKGL